MSYPIQCDNCAAAFTLEDALFDEKVRGRTVAIRCRKCDAEILVVGDELVSKHIDDDSVTTSVPPAAGPTADANQQESGRPTPEAQQPATEAPRPQPAPRSDSQPPAAAELESATPGSPKPPPADVGDKPSTSEPIPADRQETPSARADESDPAANDDGGAAHAEQATQPDSTEESTAAARERAPSKPKMSARDLSVQVSLAGVFDDVPDSVLADELVKSVREPKAPVVGARKPPSPPRRPEPSRPKLEQQLRDSEFDIDFQSLSAPLDLRAPSLAELTTPPTPEVAGFGAPPSGKWIHKPPMAALTTGAATHDESAPARSEDTTEATAPESPAPPARRNWLAVGLVVLATAGAMYGVGFLAGADRSDAPARETASAEGSTQPEARATETAARKPEGSAEEAVEAPPSDDAKADKAGKSSGPATSRLPGEGRPSTKPNLADTQTDSTPPSRDDKPPKPAPVAAAAKPASGTSSFDRNAAVTALNAAAASASSCRRGSDPSGVATVVVTFSPSGRVTNANVSGPPFAGTPTGGCIAATMRRARVPPFSGANVTVSKRVVIR